MADIVKMRILFVDNDLGYRRSLRRLLELENYNVDDTSSKDDAIHKLRNGEFNLAIIDLRLEDDEDNYDISGLEVAKAARENNIPCVMVTAFDTVEIVRLALHSKGSEQLAKDVIPKSGGPRAVLDAIQVIFSSDVYGLQKDSTDLKIDLDQRLVWFRGKEVKLTRNQYAILSHLYLREGVVCSPEELIKAVYNEIVPKEQANRDRRLERLIERLQEKIEDKSSEPQHLIKIYGRGYRLVTDPEE